MRLAWLDEQWNRPDRSDHYRMLVAQRVLQAAVAAKDVGKIKLEDQRLTFKLVRTPAHNLRRPAPKKFRFALKKQTPAELALTKSVWRARLKMNLPPKDKGRPRHGD